MKTNLSKSKANTSLMATMSNQKEEIILMLSIPPINKSLAKLSPELQQMLIGLSNQPMKPSIRENGEK